MRVRLLIGIFIGLAVLFTNAPAQTRYELRTLDVEAHFGPGYNALAGYINDIGQYAGLAREGFVGPIVPFIWNWEDDTVTLIDEFTTFYPPLINNAGQLAGQFTVTAGIGAGSLWDPLGGLRQLSTEGAIARALNDRGEIGGDFGPPLGLREAAIWSSDGEQRYLGGLSPGSGFSRVHSLSESGEAVGVSADDGNTSAAVYWNADGEISRLIGINFDANSINARGEIVGRSPRTSPTGERTSGAAYWPDRFSDPIELPCPPVGNAGTGCEPRLINDRGEILGWADPDEGDRPVIWIDGQVHLVEDLVDDFPETTLLFGVGLNNRGEIGGFVVDLWDSTETPVVLIPVDATRLVRIDVKPDVYPSCFRIDGRRTVPVAIFGEEDFDVFEIDERSLVFEGLVVKEYNGVPLCSSRYVDEDAFVDMVCQFEDIAENWTGAEPEATLTGQTFEGLAFEGAGEICLLDALPAYGHD